MSWRSAPVWDGEYNDVRWLRRGVWEDGVCGGRTVVLVFRELWRSGRTFLAALHGASAVSDLALPWLSPCSRGVVRFTCKSVYLTHFQNTVVQEALYVPRGGENVLSGERGGEGLAHTAQRALFLRPAELLCFLLQGQQQCGRGRRLSRAAVSCSSLCLTSRLAFFCALPIFRSHHVQKMRFPRFACCSTECPSSSRQQLPLQLVCSSLPHSPLHGQCGQSSHGTPPSTGLM